MSLRRGWCLNTVEVEGDWRDVPWAGSAALLGQ